MPSRKRPAIDPAPQLAIEKKPRSNSRDQIFGTSRKHSKSTSTEIRHSDLKSEPISHVEPLDIPERCIHKRQSACSLSLLVCCACADKRPLSEHYLKYVDGRGSQITKLRSIHYCHSCSNIDVPRRSLEHSKEASRLIRVLCADRVFDFVRSADLTLSGLQLEVAMILGCAPAELGVVPDALAVNLYEEMSFSFDSLLVQASCIRFRRRLSICVNDIDDVDMMDADW